MRSPGRLVLSRQDPRLTGGPSHSQGGRPWPASRGLPSCSACRCALAAGAPGRPLLGLAGSDGCPGGGLLLPAGREEEEGEGRQPPSLAPAPRIARTRAAGLTTAGVLQNSGSAESMSFGKVHFAQEPSEAGGSAASTLKSPGMTHTQREGGGQEAGTALSWRQGPGAPRARPLGQLRALAEQPVPRAASSDGSVRAQTPAPSRDAASQSWMK